MTDDHFASREAVQALRLAQDRQLAALDPSRRGFALKQLIVHERRHVSSRVLDVLGGVLGELNLGVAAQEVLGQWGPDARVQT